ncbi:MAG: ABC transporter permease subunit [Rhizomicrobium sp.]
MWRILLLRAAQLLASLIGVAVLASALEAFPQASRGFCPFAAALAAALAEILRGSAGISTVTGTPALHDVARTLPYTLQLLGAGAFVAFLVGVPLGILLSASRMLRAAAPLIQIIAATPVFVAALLLIWIAVRVLHWADASQTSALSWTALIKSEGWELALRSFALPALTVGAAGAASVQLSLRRGAAAALSAPYRGGLRMLGLSAFDIDLRYATPEILSGLLEDLGDVALALISAAAVAEWVFNRNGAAVLFLKSAALGDWNVAAAVLAVFAAITLVTGFIGFAAARLVVPAKARP